jgi:hypothetical protein
MSFGRFLYAIFLLVALLFTARWLTTGDFTWPGPPAPPELRIIKQVGMFGVTMITITNVDSAPVEIRNIIFNGQQCKPPPPPTPSTPEEVEKHNTCLKEAAEHWKDWIRDNPSTDGYARAPYQPGGFEQQQQFTVDWRHWVGTNYDPQQLPAALTKHCPKIVENPLEKHSACLKQASDYWQRWTHDNHGVPEGLSPAGKTGWNNWVTRNYDPQQLPGELAQQCHPEIAPNTPNMPFSPVTFPMTLGVGQSMSYTGSNSCGGPQQEGLARLATQLVRVEVVTDRGPVTETW